MNLAELVLIFAVALVVFGPTKLPMVATHLGLIFRKIQQTREHAYKLWQQQLNEVQLLENIKKAEDVDKLYDDK
jgi:sec-independent protein translocase protein TatB